MVTTPLFPQFRNMSKNERDFLEKLWRRTGGESDRIQELETVVGLILGSLRKGEGGGGSGTFTGLTDTPGTITDGDIWYGSSGSVTALAKGTNGHILTLSSGVPAWQANAAAGAWEQIERATFSASSSESIGGSQTPSDYDAYHLVIHLQVSADAGISVWASADAGASKHTSYINMGHQIRDNATNNIFASTTATTMWASATIDANSTNIPYSADCLVHNPGSSLYKSAALRQLYQNNSVATWEEQHRFALIQSTSAIDAFIMEPTTGNMTGFWVLLGLKVTP